MNLLQETIDKLAIHGFTPANVLWVGSQNGKFSSTWETFAKIANVKYDAGYGGQEVADDLAVVGSDWWLERHEYDGSEWWEFKRLPVRAENPAELRRVIRGPNYETTLEEMHGEK